MPSPSRCTGSDAPLKIAYKEMRGCPIKRHASSVTQHGIRRRRRPLTLRRVHAKPSTHNCTSSLTEYTLSLCPVLEVEGVFDSYGDLAYLAALNEAHGLWDRAE